MTRPPDHDDAQDVARGSAAVDDEAHIAAHELGHDADAAIDLVDELAAARERGDEAAANLHLQRLRRALQRLRHDTDRLVAGRGGDLASLQRRPTNLATLVRRVVSAHPSGRHPIDADLAAVVLNVDPVKVERVVDNLLHNALRHTPPDCPVRIELTAAPVGALLAVEDGGPGLPDHLCDALARDTDDPDAFGGAVGLWLVRRFARLHGGDLSVQPNVHGRPARFEVWLPARSGRPERA